MYDWEIRQYVANKKVLTVNDFYSIIFNTSPQITEIKVARNTPLWLCVCDKNRLRNVFRN